MSEHSTFFGQFGSGGSSGGGGGGGNTIYTADDSLTGNRVVSSDGNTLRFDSTSGYIATPFEFRSYPFGGSGANPHLKIKGYGEVEIRASLNDIFTLKNSASSNVFKVTSTQTSVFGNLLVSSTYFKMQSTSQKLQLTNNSTGNLIHEIQTDGAGTPVKTKFNIIGGTSQFIVGASAIVGSESISFQGHTLVKGADTLSTSSALQVYDGDGTPSVLWDFRNNGDIVQGSADINHDLTGNKRITFLGGRVKIDVVASSGTFEFNKNSTKFLEINGNIDLFQSNFKRFRNSANANFFLDIANTTTVCDAQWYSTGTALTHSIRTGSSQRVHFNLNGSGNFLVGGSALIGSEDISLQGSTLINGTLDMNNNRILKAVVNPSVQETTSTTTFTVNADEETMGVLTSMSAIVDTVIASPTGTPVQGQKLVYRFTDDGTSRGISWNAIFRAIGVTLPTATTVNKVLYVGCFYNSTDTKWDVISVQEEA